MTDVAVVVNLHREGRLAHPTFRSLARGVHQAISDGLAVEVILVLDRADEATRDFVAAALAPGGSLSGLATVRSIEVDNGDLGRSRNDGVAATTARNICVLDSDNLITRMWLTQAVRFLDEQAEMVVAHPALFVSFGSRGRLSGQDYLMWVPHSSSLTPGFRLDVMYELGYWDAFCMARREVFVAHPYARTGAGSQLGGEDWHWNGETLMDGIHHMTVPGTGFYYRMKSEESSLGATYPMTVLPRSRLLINREVAWKATTEFEDREPITPVPCDVLPELVALALEDFDLADAERDGSVDFRRFSPWGFAGARTWWALRPNRFNAAHYRMLNADLHDLTHDQLVRHYLQQGRAGGRRARLTPTEIESLRRAAFNPSDYRILHPDLSSMTNLQATNHFLEHGRKEPRPTFLAATTRAYLESLFDSIRDDWVETHRLEPQLLPPPRYFTDGTWAVSDGISVRPGPASRIYWSAVRSLPEAVDAVFAAPWVRDGDADQSLIRYLAAVRKMRPQWSVVLVTTHRGRSTHFEHVPAGITVIELGRMMKQARLQAPLARERLLATLILQFAPQIFHVFNADLGFDAIERFGKALATDTKLFLTASRIEMDPTRNNAMTSPLLRRQPDFLDPVSAVILGDELTARTVNDITGAGADKFVVHHQDEEFSQPALEEHLARLPGYLDQ